MRKRAVQIAGTGAFHFGVIDQFSLSAAAVAPLEVRLTWTDPTAPADTSYQIERSDGAGGWYRVGTSYSDRKQFTDHGRAPSTAYTYRIRSSNSTGLSGYSAQVIATTSGEDGSGEFVGPLAGWRNFKTYYGAGGNGIADDTAAWNAALADLSAHSGYCVLWVPAGTYKITNTISLSTLTMGVAVIGADPATTKIKWAGSAGVDMMHWDAWYSRISRITFDGSGTALACLTYGPDFTTYSQTSDCVFQDATYGLYLGHPTDGGQAENYIVRCHFLRCANGVYPLNGNSMDEWCWYCRFQDCGIAVTSGGGNLQAWHCYFSGSTTADWYPASGLHSQCNDCVSIGSVEFVWWGNLNRAGVPHTITGNRVVAPTGTPITLSSGGPFLCMDNIIQAPAGWTNPILVLGDGPTLIAGNLYSIANAAPITSSILRRLDEEVIASASVDPTAPTLPGTPPNLGRTIFEVAAGASAATIQTAINNAVAGGFRSVVHLPVGSYSIGTTLTVPANSTIQILGDSGSDNGTVLNWTGAAGQPLLHLVGPSKATLKNFKVLAGAGIGILADGADQAGGHFYAEMLAAQGGGTFADTGIYVNGLDQTDVTAVASAGNACTVWAKTRGGALRGAGSAAPNRVSLLSGSVTDSTRQYRVENGGEMIARSIYHESHPEKTAVTMDDRGKLSIDANRLDYDADNVHGVVEVNGHQGDLLLVGCLLQQTQTAPPVYPEQIRLTGSGALLRCLAVCNSVIIYDLTNSSDQIWFDTTSPAGQDGFALNCTYTNNADYANLPARGSASDALIRSLLNNLRRGTMRLPGTTPAGVTDIRLSQVIVGATAGGQAVTVSA